MARIRDSVTIYFTAHALSGNETTSAHVTIKNSSRIAKFALPETNISGVSRALEFFRKKKKKTKKTKRRRNRETELETKRTTNRKDDTRVLWKSGWKECGRGRGEKKRFLAGYESRLKFNPRRRGLRCLVSRDNITSSSFSFPLFLGRR